MEMPIPTREHSRLEKLAGHYTAKEIVQPSKWTEEMTNAQSTSDGRLALNGFAVVQDYEQRQADGTVVKGHGVFRYDPASDTYELHWFTSMGDPVSVFRGGFEGNVMTLTSRHGDGWMRLIYDFNLQQGYRLRMDMSDDGQNWERIIEGDNLPRAADNVQGKVAKKTATRRSAAGKKTAAARTAARRTGANRSTVKKAGEKATVSRTAAQKKAATTGKTAVKKAAATKATAKKATAKKATGKKATGKKATGTKATGKKATRKKATAKKAVTKKASPRTVAATNTTAKNKKTAAKKTAATKRAEAGRVPAAEKRRRQASTKTSSASPPRKTTRPLGASARTAGAGGISQQRSKGAAQKGPRMPSVQKSSTRVGWHKTAAKGTRTQ